MISELMIGPMAAVISADKGSNWSVAKRLEGAEASDLLIHQKRQ